MLHKIFPLFFALSFTQANTLLNDEALAQKDSIWFSQNPHSQPIWETLQERKIKNEYFSKKRSAPSLTPVAPIRFAAEFERMTSVVVRYPFGISVEVMKELAKDLKLYCLAVSADQSAARSKLSSGGVDMSRVFFINAPTDSYWSRDFSPWPFFDVNGKPGLMDFTYNRPRPNDDAVGTPYSQALGLPLFSMDLIHVGGNFMGDGFSAGSSTALIYDENFEQKRIDSNTVKSRMRTSLGTTAYHVTADPTGNYIQHIDCWAKFLGPDKVLVNRVPTSHEQYSKIEAAAQFYSRKISAYGKPYRVFRVDTPKDEPYTNSLILNDKVLIAGMGTANDDAALSVYRNAMPGYQVMAFRGTWESTDALHCRTFGIVDSGLLHIGHIPLSDTLVPNSGKYTLNATITDHSGKGLILDSLIVYYKVGTQPNFSKLILTSTGESNFTGSIPAPNSSATISYYLHAVDNSGRKENHPFIGGPDPHQFYAKIGSVGVSKKTLNKKVLRSKNPLRTRVITDGKHDALGKSAN